MTYPIDFKNKRQQQRVNSQLPASVSIGSQLTVQGKLKDISLTSVFIIIKNSVFLNINDEVGFSIQCSGEKDDQIHGYGYVSRLVTGEGLVIFFTKMDKESKERLNKVIGQQTGGSNESK